MILMRKYTKEERNKIADELCDKNNLIRLEDCTGIHNKFKTRTKEGYFVYPNICSLRENKQPLKFSTSNSDTIYNINLWIKLNDNKFELISKEYKGKENELIWQCKNIKCKRYNKDFIKSWDTVKQNHACPDCGIRKMREAQQNKLPLNRKSLLDIYPEICNKCWDYKRNNKLPNQYFPYSNQKAYWKCGECGNLLTKKLVINNVVKHGVSCPKCSDGISYPEKLMFNVLLQLDINFEIQKMFKWSKNAQHIDKNLSGRKFFDFWIKKDNCIIETHGNHHYKQAKWRGKKAKTLKEEQENDIFKQKLAQDNGIEKYIIIDCKISDLEYIKTNILSSDLCSLYNLNIIDWEKAHEYACKNITKEISELWNNGNTINEIIKSVKLSRSVVINYLKKGSEVKWCNYNPKEEMKKVGQKLGQKMSDKNGKSIIQLTMKGEYINKYETISEAARKLNLRVENISAICHGRKKSAGGFIFVFEKDYVENPQIVKNKCEEIIKPKNIDYLLTGITYIGKSPTGEEYEFTNQHEFAKIHGLHSGHINNCLKGRLKTHKKWKFKIKANNNINK